MKDPNVYPPGLDAEKVQEIIAYYDSLTEIVPPGVACAVSLLPLSLLTTFGPDQTPLTA